MLWLAGRRTCCASLLFSPCQPSLTLHSAVHPHPAPPPFLPSLLPATEAASTGANTATTMGGTSAEQMMEAADREAAEIAAAAAAATVMAAGADPAAAAAAAQRQVCWQVVVVGLPAARPSAKCITSVLRIHLVGCRLLLSSFLLTTCLASGRGCRLQSPGWGGSSRTCRRLW